MSNIPISFRSSSLTSFESCPRMFGAKWLVDNKLAGQFAPDLRPTKQNVGAAVGSAVHAGHAFLMDALKNSGNHGTEQRKHHAVDVARAELDKIMTGQPIIVDNTCKNALAADHAVAKIMAQMYLDYRPDVEPLMVERGFKAIWRYKRGGVEQQVRITGTIDLYLLDETLPDLKTGRWRPAPYAQLGTYRNLLELRGYPVRDLHARYYKRVSAGTQQPAAEIIPIDKEEATAHAKLTACTAHRDMSRTLKTGSPVHLMARYDHPLCDPRFCPAFGTSFCSIGKTAHPERVNNAR